jgi:16S rRNA (adenine1518-N6/adenine1519-N6)-dimethyltransferase
MSFFAKKSLGQHFLTSVSALQKIIEASNITSGEVVLEVGPGRGVLTEKLLQAGAKVIAVEKDDELIPVLEEQFASHIKTGRLRLVHGDILELPASELVTGHIPFKIVANIPYYITGHFLRLFLSGNTQPTSMTLLIQKEVALRIIGKEKLSDRPDTSIKNSVLSISIQAYGTPEYVATVPRGAFSPAPKIDSAIIHIKNISKDNFENIMEDFFFKIVSTGFAQKRKKLFGNLKKITSKEIRKRAFSTCGISIDVRAEELTINNWLCLTNTLKS